MSNPNKISDGFDTRLNTRSNLECGSISGKQFKNQNSYAKNLQDDLNDFERTSVNRGFQNPPGVNDIDFNPDDLTQQDNIDLVDDEPEDDPFYKERGIFR